MKFLRFLFILFVILAFAAVGLWLSGYSYLFKGLWATYLHGETSATITDARFFDLREVPAGTPQPWSVAENYNDKNLSDTLRKTLEATKSIAFLVMKNDEIMYEEYWDGYSDTSHTNSFSMAKSITTLLAQKAIEEGYIQSWEDPVTDYLPKIQGPYRQQLKLKHLSQMTSGLQWSEDYKDPFDITARAYYSNDVAEVMYEFVPVVKEPGSDFEYQSGAPQVLGLVITKATGKTLSQYASETLWKPMGAEQTAFWHLDDEGGMELTYCCFNSNARDFARFGKLLINHGEWEGSALIDSAFLAKATRGAEVSHYGWSFWIFDDYLYHTYYMRGLLGQYVIVIPEKDLVIVRLGKENIKDEAKYPQDLKVIVEETVKYFGK